MWRVSLSLSLSERAHHVRKTIAFGKPSTPAPTMAVTLWKAAYHHLALRSPVIGNQSSTLFVVGCPFSSTCSCTESHTHSSTKVTNAIYQLQNISQLLLIQNLRCHSVFTPCLLQQLHNGFFFGASFETHSKIVDAKITNLSLAVCEEKKPSTPIQRGHDCRQLCQQRISKKMTLGKMERGGGLDLH